MISVTNFNKCVTILIRKLCNFDNREANFTSYPIYMKNKSLLLSVAVYALLSIPFKNFSQTINYGSAANFVILTTVGAIGNTGTSQLTGNVGTNSGGTTNFGNVNGVMYSGDGATGAASNSLLSAYSQLNSAIPTATHAPLLGNGETLVAGVYSVSGVTVLSNVLTLDGQGSSNAVFIFKISAAFSSTNAAEIKLINGALACNVHWKVEGAVTLASLTIMKGNIVANNDLISLATGSKLEGRMLAINGAISVNEVTAKTPIGCGSPVLTGPAAPFLGSSVCYALFSGNENISNSGSTTVKGDIGTNVGLTTGFNPLMVDGMIHPIPDGSTAAAASALLNARTYMNSLTADIELLYPAQMGRKLVLTPHTYVLNGATSLNDTLFLNAEGNANAIFVIKIYGAFNTGDFATVTLMNGTLAKNVYWIVNGAVTIATGSNLKGSIVSNNGAINLATGVQLEGRAMTTNGALTTSSVTVNMTDGCAALPLTLTAFTGKIQNNTALLAWKTSNEINTSVFEIEQSIDARSYTKIGTVNAAGNTSGVENYEFNYNLQAVISPVVYYRLKMIDVDGKFTYSNIVALQMQKKSLAISMYPNPVKSTSTLIFTTQQNERISYSFVDAMGKVLSTTQVDLVAGSNTIRINAKALAVGLYSIRIIGTEIKETVQFVKQ